MLVKESPGSQSVGCATLHSAVSSTEFPDLHTTQTLASEVGEVHASVVTEWPPACLHKLLPRGHQTANKEILKWKKFPT